jgi:hypothetical protein
VDGAARRGGRLRLEVLVTTAANALAEWRQARGRGVGEEDRTRIFWVALGPLTLPVPHPGKLRWHDLHHVVLGYETDVIGEIEISAFELRTGVKSLMVLLLCLAGVALGLFVAPRRTLRAWREAKGRRNLYGLPWEELKEWPMSEVRAYVSASAGPG